MKTFKEFLEESSVKVGTTFNHKGLTWKVVKAGTTQSKAEVVTKSKAGETEVFDNKVIKKAAKDS
jgi:hypothetical protein